MLEIIRAWHPFWQGCLVVFLILMAVHCWEYAWHTLRVIFESRRKGD